MSAGGYVSLHRNTVTGTATLVVGTLTHVTKSAQMIASKNPLQYHRLEQGYNRMVR